MLGCSGNLTFSFLNFVRQVGTVTRFESPARNKHKMLGAIVSGHDKTNDIISDIFNLRQWTRFLIGERDLQKDK